MEQHNQVHKRPEPKFHIPPPQPQLRSYGPQGLKSPPPSQDLSTTIIRGLLVSGGETRVTEKVRQSLPDAKEMFASVLGFVLVLELFLANP